MTGFNADLSNYRTWCQIHEYGEYTHEWDRALSDKELHVANNPQCENAAEIHETDAAGTDHVRVDAQGNEHW